MCNIRGIAARHKINHFYLGSMPAHTRTLHRIVARIFHIPWMMAAREIRECAGLINKVTYKPANDLSPG